MSSRSTRSLIGVTVPTKRSLQAPFNSDMFYDGKNSEETALLRIRLAQFANVGNVQVPGTWLDILAEIGGANGLLMIFLGAIRRIVLAITRNERLAACATVASCIGAVGSETIAPS